MLANYPVLPSAILSESVAGAENFTIVVGFLDSLSRDVARDNLSTGIT
jgi:hypothetical protein